MFHSRTLSGFLKRSTEWVSSANHPPVRIFNGMHLVYNQLVKYLEYDKLKKLMGDWMKKLLIITLTLFLVSNSYAEEMSLQKKRL